jgi:small subunit ribosomal protein S6
MRPYEVMVIFDAGAEPPAIQAVVDRLLDTVRANEGTPGHIDRWGRRPFAYEVKHRREGYYVLVEFAGMPKTVEELDRMLGLADEVLRHKVIRLPEKLVRRGGTRPDSRPHGRPERHAEAPVPATVAAAPAEAAPATVTATAVAEPAAPVASEPEPTPSEPEAEAGAPADES